MNKVAITMGIVMAGLLVVAGLTTIACFDSRQRIAHHDALWNFTKTCTPIIAWVEVERAKSGKYPEELPPRFKAAIEQVKPQAWYETSKSNTWFSIGFGDYGEDGFVYEWDSDRGGWMWGG